MSEKRLFPRVVCSFPVFDDSSNRIGNAVDISFGGILVESTSLVNQDLSSKKTIKFLLEGQKEWVKTKVATLRMDDFDSGRKLIAYSFIEFSPGSDELISNYIIRSLWKNVFTPINNKSDIPGGFFSKLYDKKEIEDILLDASKTKALFFCVQEEEKGIFQFILQKVEHNTLLFKAYERFSGSQVLDRRDSYFNVTLGYSNYLFFSDKPVIKGQKLTIPIPEILFACSRRSEKREDVRGKNMSIIIPLPYPSGAILERNVIDISNNGLAFYNPINDFYFLPGTPIANLKVLAGKKKFITKGEIRHITPVFKDGKEAFLKVGVFFPGKKRGFLTDDVKSSSSSSTYSFVKTGSGIFKDLAHCMKGLAVQGIYMAQKGMISRSLNYKKSQNVDILRIKNKKNEEIVGILNTTWDGMEKKNAHVIIIPPAFGKRKESTGPLALALIENFKRAGVNLAIIRFDGIRNLGESYKEAIYRQLGRETIAMSLSQSCADLKTVVSFANNNERFICKKIILLTFSMGALTARHLLAQNKLGSIDLWIAGMGMPNAQDVLKNVVGGIDYIENQRKQIFSGEITILGVNIDTSIFCQDALDNKMATLEDAISEMKQISTPLDWILGENDAWIDRSQVEMLINSHKTEKASLHLLKMGHVPMTGLESLRLFKVITNILFKALLQKETTPVFPMPGQLDDIRIREWDRAPKYPLTNPEKYWAGYLLGEEEEEDGYDVLWLSEDYVRFLNDELKALEIKSDCKVADMGCGTGNFGQLLIKDHLGNGNVLPNLTLVDLVPEALEKVKHKYNHLLKDLSTKKITFKRCDLEINHLIPVKQFLEGSFYSLDKFKGKINGLCEDTIELWKERYSELLHQILRGKHISSKDNQFLKESFASDEINFIKDMNLAARFLNGLLTNDDFLEKKNSGNNILTTDKLRFNVLDFGNSNLDFRLPFEDDQFDRILSSLVLSYLKNPDVTFSELVRCLKPGGKIVVSSMKPDTDMSVMYTNMIKKIEQSDQYSDQEKTMILKSIRTQGNRMALLLTLVEECQFRFFSKEEMMAFAEENNLKDVTITESYGDPAQSYILSGVK